VDPVQAFSSPNFNPVGYAENVAGSALVGCASPAASGGSCGSGAAAGAVSAGFAPLTATLFPNASGNLGERIGGTFVQATAGGLASVAGGGKFANGAVTGAFGYLVSFGSTAGGGDPRNANACLEDACVLEVAGGAALIHWAMAILTAGAGAYAISQTTSSDDVQYVVRGGAGAANSFQNGTAATQNGYGFSVQTAPGVSIDELARGGYFPNGQISVSTVEQLEAIPGVTVNFPTPGRGDYHGTVNVPNPPPPGFFNAISGAFRPQPNPFPVPR
jgi:hypothetical protein